MVTADEARTMRDKNNAPFVNANGVLSIPEGFKKCSGCGWVEPITNFRKSRNAKDGHRSQCKVCHSIGEAKWRKSNQEKIIERRRAEYYRNHDARLATMRNYRKNNPEKLRAIDRKRKYGLTQAQWDALFISQGSKCAICGGTDPKAPHWHTDHCHETGVVRGILCAQCNLILRKHVTVETLLRAADYLRNNYP